MNKKLHLKKNMVDGYGQVWLISDMHVGVIFTGLLPKEKTIDLLSHSKSVFRHD